MIIPIYKPVGVSTHSFVKLIGEQLSEKVTHTGSLDPMAEGVVVMLTGEDRFNKKIAADWRKTYQVDVLFGIGTDTHDILGMADYGSDLKDLDHISREIINFGLKKFIGRFAQTLPCFAARRINGESYFDLAKRGEDFVLAKEMVEVFQAGVVGVIQIKTAKLEMEIEARLKKVQGDFRQVEIINKWQELFENLNRRKTQSLPCCEITLTTSRRTYVRSLVRDLGRILGFSATVLRLVRSENGPFNIQSCVDMRNTVE